MSWNHGLVNQLPESACRCWQKKAPNFRRSHNCPTNRATRSTVPHQADPILDLKWRFKKNDLTHWHPVRIMLVVIGWIESCNCTGMERFYKLAFAFFDFNRKKICLIQQTLNNSHFGAPYQIYVRNFFFGFFLSYNLIIVHPSWGLTVLQSSNVCLGLL